MHILDYKHIDYRGFVFAVHPKHGLLLLHCTRKPKKGPHYQLPGGHVDDFEFEASVAQFGNESEEKILLEACKMGTARELFEETGIDIRGQLERLDPAEITNHSPNQKLNCLLKNKCYFHLQVDDEDFFSKDLIESDVVLIAPANLQKSENLLLRISEEHSGFIFEQDPFESINKLKQHSGGSGSMALQISMQNYAQPNPNAPIEDMEICIDLSKPDTHDSNGSSSHSKRSGLGSCFC